MAETIKIGPFHPALLEPEVFEVTVKDGKILKADIDLGYAHRSIEKLMTTKTYRQNVFLAERVCGICSMAHSTAYCQTVEDVINVQVPDRARYLRSIFFELERLESHYLWFAVLSHALHKEDHFLKIMADREQLMDLFEHLTGNRVHYAVNQIGGTRVDLTPHGIGKVRDILRNLRVLSEYILQAMDEKGEIAQKTKGLGILPKDKALALGVVGPTLRGSGIQSDTRKDDPYAAYNDLDFDVPIGLDGDAYSRALVRAKETVESLNMIEQALDNLPSGPVQVEASFPLEAEAVGRVEAPRGELVYFIKSNGTEVPERVKIRTPSYMNDYSVTYMLIGEELANFQIITESVDPCFSCTDRLTIIDQDTGRRRLVPLSQLREVR